MKGKPSPQGGSSPETPTSTNLESRTGEKTRSPKIVVAELDPKNWRKFGFRETPPEPQPLSPMNHLLRLAGVGKPHPAVERQQRIDAAKERAQVELTSIGQACISADGYIAPIVLGRKQANFLERSYGEDTRHLFEDSRATSAVVRSTIRDATEDPSSIGLKSNLASELAYRDLSWITEQIDVRIAMNPNITEVSMRQVSGENSRNLTYWVEPITDSDLNRTPTTHPKQAAEGTEASIKSPLEALVEVSGAEDNPTFLIGRKGDTFESTFESVASVQRKAIIEGISPSEYLERRGYKDIQKVSPGETTYLSGQKLGEDTTYLGARKYTADF